MSSDSSIVQPKQVRILLYTTIVKVLLFSSSLTACERVARGLVGPGRADAEVEDVHGPCRSVQLAGEGNVEALQHSTAQHSMHGETQDKTMQDMTGTGRRV